MRTSDVSGSPVLPSPVMVSAWCAQDGALLGVASPPCWAPALPSHPRGVGGLLPDPQEPLMGLAQAEKEMGQRASPPGVQFPLALKRQWLGETKLSIPCGNVC